MTNFISQHAQRIILAILFVSLSANTLFAQFPVEEANTMVGSWKVTNIDDYSIQLQINRQNQFRMLVNGKASEGQIEASDDVVNLNFSDGTRQSFNKSFANGQLIFEATQGTQRFVMDRADAESTPARSDTGFPTRQSTESDSDEDADFDSTEEMDEDVSEVSPSQKVVGKWYAKLEDDQIEVFIKSDFREDGTYTTSIMLVAGSQKEKQTDKGRWSVENGNLISVSDGETEREIAPIQFSENDLVVDMTNEFGTRMVMSRSPDQVKPSQFDINKLIEYAQGQADGGR